MARQLQLHLQAAPVLWQQQQQQLAVLLLVLLLVVMTVMMMKMTKTLTLMLQVRLGRIIGGGGKIASTPAKGYITVNKWQ
jgi:hypothetical protein